MNLAGQRTKTLVAWEDIGYIGTPSKKQRDVVSDQSRNVTQIYADGFRGRPLCDSQMRHKQWSMARTVWLKRDFQEMKWKKVEKQKVQESKIIHMSNFLCFKDGYAVCDRFHIFPRKNSLMNLATRRRNSWEAIRVFACFESKRQQKSTEKNGQFEHCL